MNRATILSLLLLAACREQQEKIPVPQAQKGIERSVADVRAAETAAALPLPEQQPAAQ